MAASLAARSRSPARRSVASASKVASPLQRFISRRRGRIAILDGAMGTALAKKGLSEGDAWRVSWSLFQDGKCDPKFRALVSEVHHDYLSAGVDILSANTYSISVVGALMKWKAKSQQEAEELCDSCIREAIAVAREAVHTSGRAPDSVLIAATLGSYGTSIPGRAETANREGADGVDMVRRRGYGLGKDEAEAHNILKDFHMPRTRAAAAAGADILAFETIPDEIEARAIASCLEEVLQGSSGTIPDVWVCFTCPDAVHVDNGDRFETCIRAIASCPFINAVGVNCSAPHLSVPLLRITRRVLKEASQDEKLCVIYPNSGERYLNRALRGGEMDHWQAPADGIGMEGPEGFACAAEEWHEEGADVIGGCCRVTAADLSCLIKKFPSQQ